MKMSFDDANLVINEQSPKETIEVYVDLVAQTPMSVLAGICDDAPGLHSSELALSGMRLSEDKTKVSLPFEVQLIMIDEFCEYIQGKIPSDHLRGIRMTEFNDELMKQPLSLALAAIFEHRHHSLS